MSVSCGRVCCWVPCAIAQAVADREQQLREKDREIRAIRVEIEREQECARSENVQTMAQVKEMIASSKELEEKHLEHISQMEALSDKRLRVCAAV